MTDKVMYWMSVLFSVVSLLLIITGMAMISGNRSLQTEINQRQMSIDTAARLTQLNQNLAQALAEASIKNEDKDIRDLLSSQGISVKPGKDAAGSQAPAKKK
jgi:hypothetical protein